MLTLGLCLLPSWGWSQEQARLQRGHVFFETDFEGASAMENWAGATRLAPGCQSAQSLFVERTAETAGSTTLAELPLSVEPMRGCLVYVSAMVKAENVAREARPDARPDGGIRLMTRAVVGDERIYESAHIEMGTFDWKRVVFPARVPNDAATLTLLAGLQWATGKVWFDNVKVTLHRAPRAVAPRPAQTPVFKGHDLPRLRGVGVFDSIDEAGLRLLGQEWNANVIRWHLIRWRAQARGDLLDLAAYDQWLEDALKKLDAALPLCEKYGLMVVIDLHSPPGGDMAPGGYIGTRGGIFTNAACQRRFVEVWEHLARRYKDCQAVWGYDLGNEPHETAVEDGLLDWEDLAVKIARAIRAIDADRAIIVEPPRGWGPAGLGTFLPLDIPNVVYSVHMYEPSAFTHQGVHEQRDKQPWVRKVGYPGEIEGKLWDKARLEAALKPAIDFQKTYGAHLFIGEFSAVRWAPDNSAHRYLRDLIALFEEHGWDWTYFVFLSGRGWTGMSVQHESPDPADNTPAAQPTDRQKLLRDWFAKNHKPSWYRAP